MDRYVPVWINWSFSLCQKIVKVGDELVFGYCGAYGFTESMPFFLCHQLAAEYVIQENKLVEVRSAKPASSYLA